VSLDEREDDDNEALVDGMKFVASEDIVDGYGSKFSVVVLESGKFGVSAGW